MENVMLNTLQTQIKIVDFGLSNIWSVDSPLKTHCGSPEYAAPELFITGREYGPEVDLWSLGIILYGMVVGQLPFVSNRDSHISSQDRRKRLVAQINKGLAASQRRMISTNSIEFRSVMTKLLVTDSIKRITIDQLLVHPWITDKGTKVIRSNPMKKLDALAKNKICRDIGSLVEMDYEEVECAISHECLGPLGGMYNILSYRLTSSLLNGDGVTRTLSTALGVRPMTVRREYTPQKLSTSRTDPKRSAPRSAPPVKPLPTYTPRIVMKASPSRSKYRVTENEEIPPRPKTAVATSRVERALPVKRSVMSASLTRKPATTLGKEKIYARGVSTGRKPEVSNEVIMTGSRGINQALNLNKASKLTVVAKNTQTDRTQAPPASTATTTQKNVSKSDTVAALKRPKTANTIPLRRSAKHNSVSPVAVSQSVSKTTYTKMSTDKLRSVAATEDKTTTMITGRTFAQAAGDKLESRRPFTPVTPVRSPQEPRKPLIYDPIARSIADYLANNVSDKLRNFKLPKHL